MAFQAKNEVRAKSIIAVCEKSISSYRKVLNLVDALIQRLNTNSNFFKPLHRKIQPIQFVSSEESLFKRRSLGKVGGFELSKLVLSDEFW